MHLTIFAFALCPPGPRDNCVHYRHAGTKRSVPERAMASNQRLRLVVGLVGRGFIELRSVATKTAMGGACV